MRIVGRPLTGHPLKQMGNSANVLQRRNSCSPPDAFVLKMSRYQSYTLKKNLKKSPTTIDSGRNHH